MEEVHLIRKDSKIVCCLMKVMIIWCKIVNYIVKLRERERHRVDQGQGKKRKKKWMVDGGYPFPDALH